jgi:hypothetical protein
VDPNLRRRRLSQARIEIFVWTLVLAACIGLALGGNRSPDLLGVLLVAPLVLVGSNWARRRM